jgi:protein-disulfide isomerase/uncharacterized membrane protein
MSTPAPPRRRGPALFAIGLALAGIAVSIVLLRSHLTVFEGDVAGGLFCGGAGGRFDCDTVAAHPSSWLLGLPLPFWGIVFYVAAGSLALLAWRLPEGEASAAAGAGTVLSATAVILDAWLGWIMVRQIGAICLNCVATYLLNLGLVAAFWRLDRAFTTAREWPALLTRWHTAGPGRAVKIVTALVAIAGASAAFAYTRGAVNELLADSQDEASQLLRRFDTEPPLDMTQFEGLPAEGPAGARVTIVVASDFECSFCRNLAARLDEIRAEYPNDVRILFLNAPISPKCNPRVTHEFHEHACWLARAGVCAARQGRFWQYHDLVYRDLAPARVNERGVRRALSRAGIDPAALDSCLAGAEADSVVARDVRRWRELKMDSVPSIVINGHVKTRGIYPNALRTVVRALLARPA